MDRTYKENKYFNIILGSIFINSFLMFRIFSSISSMLYIFIYFIINFKRNKLRIKGCYIKDRNLMRSKSLRIINNLCHNLIHSGLLIQFLGDLLYYHF